MVTEAAGLLVMDKHLLGTEEALSKAVPSIHPVHIQMLLNAWRPDEYLSLSQDSCWCKSFFYQL